MKDPRHWQANQNILLFLNAMLKRQKAQSKKINGDQMVMRKMRVSFDLDIPVFLSMLATANSSMRIEILGDAKPIPAKLLNGHGEKPKQLPAPKPRHIRVRPKGAPTIYSTLLAFLAKHKDRAVRNKELEPVIVGIGANRNSVSPQLVQLQADGYIKRVGAGEYKITAKGVQKVTAS